jgi:CubicO group peptidase (beta-lactamase class C family)
MRLLSAFVALALAVTLNAQKVDPYAIDKAVNNNLKTWQIPGAAIAIVLNDRIVYVKGYGTKEAGGTEPVTPETLFQIASTSKAFTSAAMALLVDEQKVAWDDPVREHLDYFHLADPCADASVTVRDVLSHRTGLSRHDELWDNTPLTREELVRRIGFVPLTKPFRSGYQYQNIMFVAAGEVIGHASGMSWDDFVRTRLFGPLGMTRTITSDAEWKAADHASGHRWDDVKQKLGPQEPIDTKTLGSAGAIKSCARDMANWVRFQLADGFFDNRRIVSAEALAETKTAQTVIRHEGMTRESNPETSVMAYGMGWTVQDYRGELLVSHGGALNGFRTHVDLLPKKSTGFVILMNAGRGLAAVALRNTLSDMLTGKAPRDWNAYYLMVDARSNDRDRKEKEERLAKRRADTHPSHALADYAGVYESPSYGTVRISVVNDALVLQWNRMTVPLAHWHYDVFAAVSEVDGLDEQVTFGTGASGEIATLEFFGESFARKK